MWKKYHKLTCSDDFRKYWSEFLYSSVGVRSVLFFNFVTKFILEELIKAQMPPYKTAGEVAARKTAEEAATLLKKALLLSIELLENCQIKTMEPDGDTLLTEWLVAVN
uniref:Uncharacterized protein n=1 Tax=Amphimedon queenslandica TaxID=400682 RepID=A0A1X7U6I2_AMPQE